MVEYKFKIGDRIRRVSHNLADLKTGDEEIVKRINSAVVFLEGRNSGYTVEYFELVKPKEEIINNYELY